VQDWQQWIGAALAAVLALVALGLGVALRRARTRAAGAVAAVEELRGRLDQLEHRVRQPPASAADQPEFVITHLGEDEPAPTPTGDALGSALFADIVLRETVVKAAGLAHGVRRALDPETLHRIRFEVRREVKRARKQRRAAGRRARHVGTEAAS
jgi:hypothetical protein